MNRPDHIDFRTMQDGRLSFVCWICSLSHTLSPRKWFTNFVSCENNLESEFELGLCKNKSGWNPDMLWGREVYLFPQVKRFACCGSYTENTGRLFYKGGWSLVWAWSICMCISTSCILVTPEEHGCVYMLVLVCDSVKGSILIVLPYVCWFAFVV